MLIVFIIVGQSPSLLQVNNADKEEILHCPDAAICYAGTSRVEEPHGKMFSGRGESPHRR
jgi:hypothetical protein